MKNWSVGAGKALIRLPAGYPQLEGFTQVHDPICTRAVLIRDSRPSAVLIVSMEITSLTGDMVDELRTLAAESALLSTDQVWVCAAHSFSSPHLFPEEALKTSEEKKLWLSYRQALMDSVREAVRTAAGRDRDDTAEDLAGAELIVGRMDCPIAANRDIETEDGWWVGTGGDGPSDPTVTLLAFRDGQGSVRAALMHFPMQSSVMDQSELSSGGKAVTGDVSGEACRRFEQAHPGCVCLYLIGAAGDQAPVRKAVCDRWEQGQKIRTDLQEEGFAIVKELGGQLAEAADRALASGERCEGEIAMAGYTLLAPAKKMNRDLRSLRPSLNARYEAVDDLPTPICLLRLGDIVLIGVRPELNCVTAREIAGGDRNLLVCTLVNGAAKYMADAHSYDRCTYEAMNSPWGRGAAELLAQTCRSALKLIRVSGP